MTCWARGMFKLKIKGPWEAALAAFMDHGDKQPLDALLKKGDPVPDDVRALLIGNLRRTGRAGPPLKLFPPYDDPLQVVSLVWTLHKTLGASMNAEGPRRYEARRLAAALLGVSLGTVSAAWDKCPQPKRAWVKQDLEDLFFSKSAALRHWRRVCCGGGLDNELEEAMAQLMADEAVRRPYLLPPGSEAIAFDFAAIARHRPDFLYGPDLLSRLAEILNSF